jgi:methionine-rich copper-binding protein CopC
MILGAGTAAADFWPYMFDPMAVDAHDDLSNPTSGGIYTLGPEGVDIEFKIAASEYYMDNAHLQIYDVNGNKIAEKDLGYIQDNTITETMHLDENIKPGQYSVRINGESTDDFQIVVPDNSIPEFPTIALPVLAIIGLALIFRRKE